MHADKKMMRKGFKLSTLLFFLVSGAVLITAAIGSLYAWKENKEALTESYLNSNYQYAKKVATNVSEIVGFMEDTLAEIAARYGREELSEAELDVWLKANRHNFNSLFVVDESFQVVSASPDRVKSRIGQQATSEIGQTSGFERAPLVSGPFTEAGHDFIILTVPIVDRSGRYGGYAAAIINLDESNALSRLLNEHFYGDDSYLYVANSEGKLLIHPNQTRIHKEVDNEVVIKGMQGISGSQRVTKRNGDSFFAGYAFEPVTGWIIVSQTPVSILKGPLDHLVQSMLIHTLPLFLLVWIVSLLLSLTISRPLYALASFSERNSGGGTLGISKLPPPSSWIYEVRQLHISLGNRIRAWSWEAQTDGLTGIANRRAFDRCIGEWLGRGDAFALILLDIDYFKKVNDSYGHLAGDEVLRFVAAHLQSAMRDGDLCFRFGGEEFGVLAKYADQRQAMAMAEKLRLNLAAAESPVGESIHFSIGIALHEGGEGEAGSLIGKADKALYRSKEEGRNRSSVFGEQKESRL
ncbi:sensor domain-containing diguanylate cyclase [Paenibacillus sp. GCM10027627]|uniref:sensor domain-containing diguanylate cyclase n=1 Tax=unclassified Paenibacillus TaxID=185978 RepID=UPI0036295564